MVEYFGLLFMFSGMLLSTYRNDMAGTLVNQYIWPYLMCLASLEPWPKTTNEMDCRLHQHLMKELKQEYHPHWNMLMARIKPRYSTHISILAPKKPRK